MRLLGRLVLLLACALALPACLQREQYDRTPAGWHVHWIDQGTIATGLHTKGELFALFDAAMERSFPECAAKVGLPESYVRGKIKDNDAVYTLVDNFYFPVAAGSADAPTSTKAAGITYSRLDVWVAFYSKAGSSPPPPVIVAPPWTIYLLPPDTAYWGEEIDGQQYPALGWELGWQFVDHQ